MSSSTSRPARTLALPLAVLAVLAVAAGAHAAPAVVADAVAVSDASKFRSIDPHVVALAGGGFFSAWENMNEGLWGRALAADGDGLAAQRLLVANSPRPANPGEGWWIRNASPSLTPLANGGFLLVWMREATYLRNAVFHYTSTPVSREIYLQRFAADGTRIGPERRIGVQTDAFDSLPRVVAHGGGRFLAVWQRDGAEGGLRARVLAGSGLPIGRELAIAGPGAQQAAVAVNPFGDALIAWSAADADEEGIYARLFDRTMMPVGDTFRVNGEQALAQRLPRVAAGADGGFLVSWSTRLGTRSAYRNAAQLVTAAGALAGGEKLIGDEWKTTNLAPNVVALPGGGYAHLWMIWNSWYASGIFAETLDATGEPTAPPVLVSDTVPVGAHHIGLAVDSAGTLFVAWEGFNGDDRGIRGRAFAHAAP